MSFEHDPFNLGDEPPSDGDPILTPKTPVDHEDVEIGSLPVFDKISTNPITTVPDLDDSEIALIDMQTQQMDEHLAQELERAHQLRHVIETENRIADGTVSRETVSYFTQHYPEAQEWFERSLGGLGGFTVNPSRIGLESFRAVVRQKRDELAMVNTYLTTEDATGEQIAHDVPLFGYLSELEAKVLEATKVLNETHDHVQLPPLTGNDRYVLSTGAGYLGNANLETMDRQLVVVFAGTDTDSIIKDVASIIEYFDPEKQDLRTELGLSELTMENLRTVMSTGRLLDYIASLHAKLGMLIADIRPGVENYLSADRPEYRDSTVLVKLIEPTREYCRLAKRYIRMCRKLQMLEGAVRRLLDKQQQYAARA